MQVTEELRAKLEQTACRLAARKLILYFYDTQVGTPPLGQCGFVVETRELAIRLSVRIPNVAGLLEVFLHECGHAAYKEFRPVTDKENEKKAKEQALSWWQGACVLGGFSLGWLPDTLEELDRFLNILMTFGKETHIYRDGHCHTVMFGKP